MVYLSMVYSILVVEDDRKIARIVKVYLENEGFKVVTVEKGKDAITSVLNELTLL